MASRGRRAQRAVACLLGVALAGCGAGLQQHYGRLRPLLRAGEPQRALAAVEAAKDDVYGDKNRLLFELDCGMLLQLAGRYRDSNRCLERAKEVAQALWTEQVSAHAAAWVGNDNALPYQGEDFEKVFIHLAAAFNYLSLKAFGEARVEARQVVSRLALLRTQDRGSDYAYRDDAFARWLSGRLAEADRSDLLGPSDAWIDYRRAWQIYEQNDLPHYGTPLPQVLVRAALRVLGRLGKEFAADRQALLARLGQKSTQQISPPAAPPPATNLVLIHLAGEAPTKQDAYWLAPALDTIIRVAYPVFVRRPQAFVAAVLTDRGSGAQGRTELMQDVAEIAIRNLADRMGQIRGKAVGRAVAKFVAAHAAQVGGAQLGNQAAGGALQVVGALLKITNFVAEEADTRSWVTLPASIHVAEMSLAAGHHTLDVELLGHRGALGARQALEIDIVPQRTTFVITRSML